MHPPRRSRRNAGFIILFGTKTVISRDSREPVQARCPGCGRTTTIQPMKARQWFTLFFIPVIPLGKAQHFCQCQACQGQFAVDIDAISRRGAMAETGDYQRAIELFNEMKATPKDSVKLHALMHAYCELGEFGEAIAAARAYPEALKSSEVCMIVLAQACAEHGNLETGITWCDRALELNPASSPAKRLRQSLTDKLRDSAQP